MASIKPGALHYVADEAIDAITEVLRRKGIPTDE